MSTTVINVEGLGKQYLIRHLLHQRVGQQHHYVALRDVLAEKAKALFRARNAEYGTQDSTEAFWALKDVSFEVKQGERVGIIGRNGAGKSTLLKILSRITEPTKGRVRIKGRVASLLEVGTGFHPELTGRENIFLNGAVLGMMRGEIRKKFDEIVAFADVEKFLDTPVKRYSSGMYVRLAFAVAAHLEPEILVVDEVLAVGDAQFQQKCLGKMAKVSKEGRTVLFVSHSMESISTLTSQAILLESGRIGQRGETSDVIAYYLSRNRTSDTSYKGEPDALEPRITWVEVVTSEPGQVHACGQPLQIKIKITTPKPLRGACLSFRLLDHQMRPIVHLWTFDSDLPMCRKAGDHLVVCTLPKLRLYMGRYFVQVFFAEPPGGAIYQTLESVCPFEIVMLGHPNQFPWKAGTCTYLEDGIWEVIDAEGRSQKDNPVQTIASAAHRS